MKNFMKLEMNKNVYDENKKFITALGSSLFVIGMILGSMFTLLVEWLLSPH